MGIAPSKMWADFSPVDIGLLLAAREMQADVGPHGLPMSVATNPENQFAFEAGLPVTDWASRTLAAEQKNYYASYPDADRSGHLWRVRLKTK